MSAHYPQKNAPRIGRLGWSLLMLIGVGLVVVLFSIKTRALEAKAHMRKLERTLERERAEVRMLGAELALLESPERLRALAEEQLGLEPVKAARVLTLEQAAQTLAKKDEKAK